MDTYKLQTLKEATVNHLIESAISAILNSSFATAANNTERQAVIEVAQDYSIDLAQVLIERYEQINKQ